ncbi:MAG: AAA family ATPase [Vicinamibacterales bacterium]
MDPHSAGTPRVVLIVGVNGTGKTTTVGKLANQMKRDGLAPLICAADTFRAAAVDQLQIWADRAGVDIVRAREGADPAAVVFDALTAGRARGRDVILVDTAGRLHTRANLMQELEKIRRVAAREAAGAPHDLSRAGCHCRAERARAGAGVHGRGRRDRHRADETRRHRKGRHGRGHRSRPHLPIRHAGVGEGIDDLLPFRPDEHVDALFQEKW